MRRSLVGLALLFLPAGARAAPGAGTLADPVRVDALPYAIKGTTVGGEHAIDRYSCATADESGPEVVYAFTLAAAARVTAWTSGDGNGVDVDVQLLDDATLAGTTASRCAGRGNVIAEAEMAAGPHFVVVDTFGGDAHAGAYVLHLEAIGDAWNERPLADGVTWRARRFGSVGGGPQVVHELVIDPTASGVSVRAWRATGCQTVGALGAQQGAIAGVNGGYFDTATAGCPSVSLLKSGGTLVATSNSSSPRGAFGLSPAQVPMVTTTALGADWPEAAEAHGGGPVLVVGGVARMGSAAWAAEGLMSASFVGRNPRTFAGSDAMGRVHMGSVDGRRADAVGMSLDAEAAFVVGGEIGARDAVNLDGGGSTTMWIAGATPNGIVNYPSDATTPEDPTHPSARPVSGGFFVHAPPYNHAPRFQTQPPLDAALGASYRYDADALDLDVDDVLVFALDGAPAAMRVDGASGVVDWTVPADAPAEVAVTLVVRDGRGGEARQSWTLAVAGGAGAAPDADGGLDGATAASAGDDAGARTPGPDGRGGAGHDIGGGCSAGGGARPDGALALLALLLLLRRRPVAALALACAACSSATSSRGRDGHATFAYLARPDCTDGCLLDKFNLASGGARQSIRVDVDTGYTLADVQSSAPSVVTFTREGGYVVAHSGAAGEADLLLVGAGGATFDRIRVGVADAARLDTTPGWTGAGPTVLAGTSVRSSPFTKRDRDDRILLATGAIQFALAGPLTAIPPPAPTAPENAVETVELVGQPGSGQLGATSGPAAFSVPVEVVATSQLTHLTAHVVATLLGDGGIPESTVETRFATDVAPVWGAACQWTASSPSVTVARETIAVDLGQPPVNVTVFRLAQPGSFTVTCSLGALRASVPLERS
jgi:hypothetical protein